MILQSLYAYYGRKRNSLPGDGIERKELPFLFVLNPDGEFLHIEDTRQGDGKRKSNVESPGDCAFVISG